MAASVIGSEEEATVKAVLSHIPALSKFDKPSFTKPACVIVACGCFSPPTFLHLRLFEDAKIALSDEFEVIGGLISPAHDEYGSLHKASLKAAKSEHRLAMCELAAKDSSWIAVSGWECTVPSGWTRTAIVMQNIHRALNNRSLCTHLWSDFALSPRSSSSEKYEIKVKFLCGADLLDSFLVPGLWDPKHVEILTSIGIVCCKRDGADETIVVSSHDTLKKHAEELSFFEVSAPNRISSTVVRKLISERKSVKYLTIDSVIEYIREHGLYV